MSMQSLVMQANTAFLEQIAKLAKELAHKQDEKLELYCDDGHSKEYQKDVDAYKIVELETISLDELRQKIAKW